MNSSWEDATFATLVEKLLEIIDVLVLGIFALILLYMTWKIIDAWIIKGGDSMAIDEGKKTITIGFIVMVILASVWGIVALLGTIFA